MDQVSLNRDWGGGGGSGGGGNSVQGNSVESSSWHPALYTLREGLLWRSLEKGCSLQHGSIQAAAALPVLLRSGYEPVRKRQVPRGSKAEPGGDG